jgi:SAM-dependent methyltransferase
MKTDAPPRTVNEFCTLFDERYLPRGIVLYRSLERVCPEFRLRALCMDERTQRILESLDLPRLETIPLRELETADPNLLAVKDTRSVTEYCWTSTPALCLHALEREPALDAITYLDADLMFFADPTPLFDELDSGSVLLVPHRFTPELQSLEATSGTYNVQFMTFRRDDRALEALRWWRERCLEWCYAEYEDGKLGDQKYLDDWPDRFAGVRVLQHPGGGLAPWNAGNFALERRNGSITVDERPLVFYHYQSLQLYRRTRLLHRLGLFRTHHATPQLSWTWTTSYRLSPAEQQLVWNPYLRAVAGAIEEVRAVDSGYEAPAEDGLRLGLSAVAKRARSRSRRAAARLRSTARRDSWKSASVAAQMVALAREQLPQAEHVPPLRVFLHAMHVLVDEHPLPEPAALLDAGCGVGLYSELLERFFPGRFGYTGSDFSPEIVAAAQAEWPGRRFVLDDVLASALDLDSFDVVVASALVDVLFDYRAALDVLLGSGAPFVLLHRQQLTPAPSHAELAAGYEGQRTYRSWLNVDDLEQIVARHRRVIAHRFQVEGNVWSFLCVRIDAP